MKTIAVITFVLVFTFSISAVNAQEQPPATVPADSIVVLSDRLDINDQAVPIPTVDIPEVAKMRTWWPDNDIDYKMQNLLEPPSTQPAVYLWDNGEYRLKGEKD